MEDRQREHLAALPAETRVLRMQGLLKGIIRSEYSSAHNMIRFMNLYDVHVPTLDYQGFDDLCARLDQPELHFSESAFDDIVASYDDLTSPPASS
jgi:hypothetical protein